jgi:MOSC domain-containing protein YiiM
MSETAERSEQCERCGFDAAAYTRQDLVGTLRPLGPIWRAMIDGVDEALLRTPPEPHRPSVRQEVAYVQDFMATTSRLIQDALPSSASGRSGADNRGDRREPDTMCAALDEFEGHVVELWDISRQLDSGDWVRVGRRVPRAGNVERLVANAVHQGTHHIRDSGRTLHTLGAGAPNQRGTLVQISSSSGGVPKTPLLMAEVDAGGVVGDRQAERRHHGRPFQALSLWSDEVIAALQDEGHSVYPGAAGENLTVRGIDWTTIRPGVRLRIGEVLAEISAFATPCVKNAQWFSDRDFRRIDHDVSPGLARAYAWVLAGGSIKPGDDVIIEP